MEMTAEAIVAISASVVALTQLLKWGFVPDRHGPLVVLLLSALGVVLWVFSNAAFTRTGVWQYFAAFVAVALSASGVYGFARTDLAQNLTKGSPPPDSKME